MPWQSAIEFACDDPLVWEEQGRVGKGIEIASKAIINPIALCR